MRTAIYSKFPYETMLIRMSTIALFFWDNTVMLNDTGEKGFWLLDSSERVSSVKSVSSLLDMSTKV